MEPENRKTESENENKENKNVDEFKKILCATKTGKHKSKNRRASGFEFENLKFEFEIKWLYFLHLSNQDIEARAIILPYKLISFSVLENKQVRRSFLSVLFMPYNKSFIDQASSVKMAGLRFGP